MTVAPETQIQVGYNFRQYTVKVCENSVWLKNFYSKPQRPYKNWLHVLKFTAWASFCFQMNLTDLALNLRVGKYEPQTHNSQVFVEILEREKNVCAK